ncbi:MAG TPA: HNH endonuclease signature motif containing protein, partial [Acidimicrobiia bacterium]
RFLVLQPSLDESWWRIWGGVDGYAGEIIEKTLTELADQLPDLPGDHGYLGAGWRKATALLDLCMGTEAPQADVSVFVTAREAAETGAESGVVLESGTKVGRRALEAILCGDTATQVFAVTENGEYMRYGRKYRLATPSQVKALLHKYGGRCAADGCNSRHRLQAHHLRPWAEGGGTNLEDLILLCWFHHHVVVHQWGYEIYHHPDHGRIRYRRPPSRAP